MRGLRARVLGAMVLVALLSAVITGVLVAPLVAGASEDELRRPVQRHAATLARLPRAASVVLRADRLIGDDRLVGVVRPTGERLEAATLLTDDDVRRLAAGDALSVARGGYLVEAAPEVQVRVDPNRAIGVGFTTAQVGAEIRAILTPTTVGLIQVGEADPVNLVFRVDAAALDSVEALRRLPVGALGSTVAREVERSFLR